MHLFIMFVVAMSRILGALIWLLLCICCVDESSTTVTIRNAKRLFRNSFLIYFVLCLIGNFSRVGFREIFNVPYLLKILFFYAKYSLMTMFILTIVSVLIILPIHFLFNKNKRMNVMKNCSCEGSENNTEFFIK